MFCVKWGDLVLRNKLYEARIALIKSILGCFIVTLFFLFSLIIILNNPYNSIGLNTNTSGIITEVTTETIDITLPLNIKLSILSKNFIVNYKLDNQEYCINYSINSLDYVYDKVTDNCKCIVKLDKNNPSNAVVSNTSSFILALFCNMIFSFSLLIVIFDLVLKCKEYLKLKQIINKSKYK